MDQGNSQGAISRAVTSQQSSNYITGKIGHAEYELDKTTHNLSITTHGMPFGTQTTGVVSGKKLGKQIHSVIEDNKYVNRVSLNSCWGGKGGRFSQGQQIADQTGLTVTAYKGKYSTINDRPVDTNGGELTTHHPATSAVSRTFNSLGNQIASLITRTGYHLKKLVTGSGNSGGTSGSN